MKTGTTGVCLSVLLLIAGRVIAEEEGPSRPRNSIGSLPMMSIAGMDASGREGGHLSKTGILFSAVVPGSGQFLHGDYLKGALFLGAEALFWYVNMTSNSSGRDWEDRFHDFADTHWSEATWNALYIEGVDPQTHSLPETKTQQYYEMIGKYDQFMKGWDDWVEGGPDLTPNRDRYETMRDKSNVAFKRASYCVMGIMANHLLSAMDSAFTIRKRNRMEAGLRMSMIQSPSAVVPALNLRAAW
ncbi:hypothetical protein JXO52_03720 [bacterium]|nr:hypothetical protein [bacterium]